MVDLNFFVLGEPLSKARARTNKNGQSFTPKTTREAEQRVADAFKEAHPDYVPADDEYTIDVRFFNKTKVKRDLDNQLKLVMDALNKIAWPDDVMVVRLSAQRCKMQDNDEPGAWVEIRTLGADLFG